MGGINTQRWLAGGVTAGAIIWLLEGAASVFYMEQMRIAMEAHGLPLAVTTGSMLISVLVSLIAGLTSIFFYAAVRPRFGSGPRTAVIVAVALWVGGYLLSLLGYQMLGLFPTSMLVSWGAVGLLEMIVATLAGAWVYRE